MAEPSQNPIPWDYESDSDWSKSDDNSDQEVPQIQYPQADQTKSAFAYLHEQIGKMQPPYKFKLSNLPYEANSVKDVYKFCCLMMQDEQQIKVDMLYDSYNKFVGEALIETSNQEVAFKVAKRNKECKGSRSILIQMYDGSQPLRGQRSRRGGRGRGNRRGNDNRRGQRYRENFQESRRGQRHGDDYQDNKRGQRQNYWQNQQQKGDSQVKTQFQKFANQKFDTRNKIQPLRSTEKIQVKTETPKPVTHEKKSNPFGNARPIDNLNQQLQYEKQQEEKVVTDEPVESSAKEEEIEQKRFEQKKIEKSEQPTSSRRNAWRVSDDQPRSRKSSDVSQNDSQFSRRSRRPYRGNYSTHDRGHRPYRNYNRQ